MKKDVVASVVNKNEIVVYQPEGGEFHIAVRVENESVWLSQAQMAELFHATKQNISLHISRIFKEGELDPKVVVKEYLTTTQHGAIAECFRFYRGRKWGCEIEPQEILRCKRGQKCRNFVKFRDLPPFSLKNL